MQSESEGFMDTQENVDEADERVETEVAREHFTFWPICCINNTFLFLLCLPKFDWLFIYSFTRVKQNVAERKRHEVQAVPAGVQTRNALYGEKLQYKNGKNEATKRENARRLPGSAFDRHRAEIQQSEEEIMQSIETTETFDFVIIIRSYFAFKKFVDSLSSLVMKTSLLNCFLTKEAV